MNRRPNLAKLQAACDAFNKMCNVGDRVAVRLDSGETINTVTTSAAEVLSGHSAVVWLSGVRGCYLLDRVTVTSVSTELAPMNRSTGFSCTICCAKSGDPHLPGCTDEDAILAAAAVEPVGICPLCQEPLAAHAWNCSFNPKNIDPS